MSHIVNRRSFLGGLGGLSLCAGVPGIAQAGSADASALQAWTGAELWCGQGRTYQRGTLLVRGDAIASVGPAGPLPEGTLVHDAKGLIITPGWVACQTALGLMEIAYESSTVDSSVADAASADVIRASHSVADGYNPNSSLLAVAVRAGITNAVATPSGGLISGTSAWVDLLAGAGNEPIIKEHLALHADVFSDSWGSRLNGVSLLRRAFENARLYERAPRAFDEGRTRPLEMSPANLAKLSESFGGRPLVVSVSRAADIVRMLALAKEYSLRLVLSGAEEGHLVADKIAAQGVAVVLNPLDNLPTSFATLHSHSDNAVRLRAAGVPVIFSSFDAHRVSILSQLAGNAVATGMSRQDALGALCHTPAQVFGMKQYGSLQAGNVANFSLWTGDPFELSSWAKTVVIRGRRSTAISRQEALFNRYRDLKSVPQGRAGAFRS